MARFHKPGTVVPYSYLHGDTIVDGWSYTIRLSDDPADTQYHTYQLFDTPAAAKQAMRVNCARSGNPGLAEFLKRQETING